jgi:hypothetical protein
LKTAAVASASETDISERPTGAQTAAGLRSRISTCVAVIGSDLSIDEHRWKVSTSIDERRWIAHRYTQLHVRRHVGTTPARYAREGWRVCPS